MGHPENGMLQALLDGEIRGEEAERIKTHLAACTSCQVSFRSLEAAWSRAEEAILLLDIDPPTESAENLLQARTRSRSNRETRRRRFLGLPFSLPRAASIALLLTGGAVAALPGSPVRRWVTQGWSALVQPSAEGGIQGGAQGIPEAPALGPAEAETPEAGAGVTPSDGGVEIWITDLPREAELRVRWVDGDEAWIFAGQGTRFNRVAGRLEAHSPTGPVRVEIPRNLRRVVVGLDGEVLLTKSGDEVEILGPVRERTTSEILFVTGGSTIDGRS